jgi:hypothetical protein
VYEGERTVLIHPDTPRPYRLDEAQSTRTCNTDSYVSKLMATQVEAASKSNHTPPYHHKAWMPKQITIISTAASNNSDFPHSRLKRTKRNQMHLTPQIQLHKPVSSHSTTVMMNLTTLAQPQPLDSVWPPSETKC